MSLKKWKKAEFIYRRTLHEKLLDCKIDSNTIDGLCGFNSNMDESVDRNIDAIKQMMIVLEDLKYFSLQMKWSDEQL